MLFLDASVIVAIVTGEPDALALMRRLEANDGPLYVSPIARMEASLSVSRRLAGRIDRNAPATVEMLEKAYRSVEFFISDMDALEIPISHDIGKKAFQATQSYGRYVAHKADLNMGDCFAYACAEECGARVAYKGDDFVHTDRGW